MRKKLKKIIFILLIAIILITVIVISFKMIQLNKLKKMSSDDMIQYVTHNDEDIKISVAVIKDGQVSYQVYGKNAATSDNKKYDYEIGSITKTFVTLLTSKAIEEGKLDIDSSISKYLELDSDKYYPTIKRLVTHTSGYKSHYLNKQMIDNFIKAQDNDFYNISKDEVQSKIKDIVLKDKDYNFKYSNFGISVLGLALEKVYDEDFISLMDNFIVEELGLQNTRVAISTGNLNGYWNWKNNDAYIPAGAIISNIEDMAKYLDFYLNAKEAYVVNTYKSLKKINANNFVYEKMGIRMDEIGMGWIIDTQSNVVWHNGATSNFNSYIGFNKDENIGVVILANLSPDRKIPMTVIGPQIMKELMSSD